MSHYSWIKTSSFPFLYIESADIIAKRLFLEKRSMCLYPYESKSTCLLETLTHEHLNVCWHAHTSQVNQSVLISNGFCEGGGSFIFQTPVHTNYIPTIRARQVGLTSRRHFHCVFVEPPRWDVRSHTARFRQSMRR